MTIDLDDVNAQSKENKESANERYSVDKDEIKEWIFSYGLPLLVGLSTFIGWGAAEAGQGNGRITAHINGINFATGRLVLGVALLMLFAVYVADSRRWRRYATFVGGLLLLTLSWYFAIDLIDLSESFAADPSPDYGVISIRPALGLFITAISSIVMITAWRAVGHQIANSFPGMRRGAKLRNVVIIAVSLLLLMEGANLVLGIGAPALEVTSAGPANDAPDGSVATATPTPTPMPTAENPYQGNDAGDFEVDDDDHVDGGVYVGDSGGSDGSCGPNDIDGDGDGVCNED